MGDAGAVVHPLIEEVIDNQGGAGGVGGAGAVDPEPAAVIAAGQESDVVGGARVEIGNIDGAGPEGCLVVAGDEWSSRGETVQVTDGEIDRGCQLGGDHGGQV